MWNIFCLKILLDYKVRERLATTEEVFEWVDMMIPFNKRLHVLRRNGTKDQLMVLFTELYRCN